MKLKPPVFELGLKAYLYGNEALALAKEADRIAARHGVSLIFTPQYTDISRIAENTKNLFVFSQHVDPIEIGRGNGSVLPEAVKAVGAAGTFLNHCEKPIPTSNISNYIRRIHEAGLAALVCAESAEQGALIAQYSPEIILAEPPELIGTDTSVVKDNVKYVHESLDSIRNINPGIIVLVSAGIRTGDDVKQLVELGADGTGSTSGVLTAEHPAQKLEEMVKALGSTWRKIHGAGIR